MKIRILSMIGVAAMAVPAAAQQKSIAPVVDASAAPQVEIPEGAFEIAIPNLATFGPEDATESAVHDEQPADVARNQPEHPSAVDMLDASNAGYSLAGATPNPAIGAATIGFTLPRAGWTTLEVFDNAGRIVATLADERLDAGAHTRRFDAAGLPAGLYLCRLSSGSYAETKTITVAR